MVIIDIVVKVSNKKYRIGVVRINNKGEIFTPIIFNIEGEHKELHTSRHKNGKKHWKFKDIDLTRDIGKKIPLDEFKGIELIDDRGFSINFVPKIFSEYSKTNDNEVFEINLDSYEDDSFHIKIYMFSKERDPEFKDIIKKHPPTQVYYYKNNNTKIAIIAFNHW